MINIAYKLICDLQKELEEKKLQLLDALMNRQVYYKGNKYVVTDADMNKGVVELSPLEGDIVFITVPIIELSV